MTNIAKMLISLKAKLKYFLSIREFSPSKVERNSFIAFHVNQIPVTKRPMLTKEDLTTPNIGIRNPITTVAIIHIKVILLN